MALARSSTLQKLAHKYGLRVGAQRFVAGSQLDDAIAVVSQLRASSLLSAINLLGENVPTAAAAQEATDDYVQLINRLAGRSHQAYVSVKPSQLGLAVDYDLCRTNLGRLLDTARPHNIFIRLDMEDSPTIDDTLELYKHFRQTGYNQIGIVIQAYLYRSAADLDALAPLKPNVRLVKGAYDEPADLAYPDKEDVDRNLKALIEQCLDAQMYVAVASHDEAILDFTRAWTTNNHIDRQQFELQMLYGIRPELQEQLARQSYQVRVYVPYGPDWYAYFMRRLAERPENLRFVLRHLFRR